jgi:hypothetical protein
MDDHTKGKGLQVVKAYSGEERNKTAKHMNRRMTKEWRLHNLDNEAIHNKKRETDYLLRF